MIERMIVMILDNAVPIPVINLPDLLKDKITFTANESLTYTESKFYEICLQALAEKMIEDKIDINFLTHLNILFTKNGSYSMTEESGDRFGFHLNLSIYSLDNIRKTNNDKFMVVTFIEELVHYFWQIEDETLTKYKVIEIAQKFLPDITLELLKEWHVNGIQ